MYLTGYLLRLAASSILLLVVSNLKAKLFFLNKLLLQFIGIIYELAFHGESTPILLLVKKNEYFSKCDSHSKKSATAAFHIMHCHREYTSVQSFNSIRYVELGQT